MCSAPTSAPFNNPAIAGKSLDEKIAFWRDERHALIGNGEEIGAQIAAFDGCAAPIRTCGVQPLTGGGDRLLNIGRIMFQAGSEGFFIAENQ